MYTLYRFLDVDVTFSGVSGYLRRRTYDAGLSMRSCCAFLLSALVFFLFFFFLKRVFPEVSTLSRERLDTREDNSLACERETRGKREMGGILAVSNLVH